MGTYIMIAALCTALVIGLIELTITMFAIVSMKSDGAALTGDCIKKEIAKGNITITDFDESRLGSNSYNLRISDHLKVVRCNCHTGDGRYEEMYYIDPTEVSIYQVMNIPEEGIILKPGQLYLIPTEERIHTNKYIPLITGRSSSGRNGIQTHLEAGFGDLGFDGVWTLQVRVVKPTKIYPGMELCQIYFLTPHGSIKKLYNGHYQHVKDAKEASPMEKGC